MNAEELIAQLEQLAKQTKESQDREVVAASVVLHALLAALLGGTTMRLAGAASAYCQLAIADARGPRTR